VIFQELPQDENYNEPVEASVFYYPFTLVMTFVVLNVSIGIIMTAYEKVSASFTAMEKNSLIDVLVNRMFADMCNDLIEEWTTWAERRTTQYIPVCLKKSKGSQIIYIRVT
jgi:hypothetical protein